MSAATAMRARVSRCALVALCCGLLCAPAGAQPPPPPTHDHALEAGLQKRVALILELEGRGDHKQASNLFVAMMKGMSTEQVSALQVALGDLHGERSDWKGALLHYEMAIKANPRSATAAMRRAQALAAMLPGSAGMLVEWGVQKQDQFPAVAEFAYRAILETAGPSPDQLEFSLLAWTNLLASQDRFVAGQPARLTSVGLPDAVAGLDAVLTGAYPVPESVSWWLGGSLRGNALANAVHSVGRGLLAAGRFAVAESVFSAGLSFAGSADALVGSKATPASRPIAYLDLATDLASLYDSHRELDPDSTRMPRIVTGLFRSKGGAYGANDLEAIQRHHMVLGTIYARRNVWTSNWGPANAVFQIEHALQAAKQREPVAGVQPLAELKSYLADGYEKTGRRDASSEMRLVSAQAFLDVDETDSAAEQLAAVDRLGPANPSVTLRKRELGTIVETRRAVAKLSSTPSTNLKARLAEFDQTGHEWIDSSSVSGLPKDFVARQRFKSSCDLSDVAYRAGAIDQASRYAAEAVSLRPDELGSLIGPGDGIRATRLVTQLSETSGVGFELMDFSKGPGNSAAGGRSYYEVNTTVLFSESVVATARITNVLKNDPDLATSASKLAFRDGKLVLEVPENETPRKAYITRRVKDVSGLKIEVVQKKP